MSLVFRNLGKTYGKNIALNGVTGRGEEGETLALVGANGGGKSTFLKLLAGILVPDSGFLEGLESRTLAYMPDHLAFSRGWTAHSWLTLVASLKGARSRVGTVLDRVGLTDVGGQSVATFSQGMVRRLLYAQTLLIDADLVLLDEPEGGLDPHWIEFLEAELDRLRAQGRSVVFSTHWLDLAVDKADRLFVFSGGRVVAQESTELWRTLDSKARRDRLVRCLSGVS